MESHIIAQSSNATWIMFGRDPQKSEQIIDTNQYLLITPNSALLMEPGGIELFSTMFAMVLRHVPVEQIEYVFASHQDPDIISSLGLWDQAVPKAKLFAPWMWESFIRHFGMHNMDYEAIPDRGMKVQIEKSQLEFIPAHYLHSSGNFNIYDPENRVLMSGDIGAALEEPAGPIFVDNFDDHIQYMRGFHQRWMPSNSAKKTWLEQVRTLDIEYICPQHGRIFRGDDVARFLDWFEQLEVGITHN